MVAPQRQHEHRALSDKAACQHLVFARARRAVAAALQAHGLALEIGDAKPEAGDRARHRNPIRHHPLRLREGAGDRDGRRGRRMGFG
ncbi:MAG: hypothetical protein MUC44_01325 [Beijerinckiaceae bacterium]|nr:hypothetical protein [Beijerinckiaceae bacterium]